MATPGDAVSGTFTTTLAVFVVSPETKVTVVGPDANVPEAASGTNDNDTSVVPDKFSDLVSVAEYVTEEVELRSTVGFPTGAVSSTEMPFPVSADAAAMPWVSIASTAIIVNTNAIGRDFPRPPAIHPACPIIAPSGRTRSPPTGATDGR